MSSGQKMRMSNEALYLAHRLLPHSSELSIAAEIQRLTQCGNSWFTQELVDSLFALLIVGSSNRFVVDYIGLYKWF